MSSLKVYLTTVRPVLEMSSQYGRQSPAGHLSDKIESLQKWVLHTIFPYIDSYNGALSVAGLDTLK